MNKDSNIRGAVILGGLVLLVLAFYLVVNKSDSNNSQNETEIEEVVVDNDLVAELRTNTPIPGNSDNGMWSEEEMEEGVSNAATTICVGDCPKAALISGIGLTMGSGEGCFPFLPEDWKRRSNGGWRNYGPIRYKDGSSRFHKGTDLYSTDEARGNYAGGEVPVYAMVNGWINNLGTMGTSKKELRVTIRNSQGDDWKEWYVAHLSSFVPSLSMYDNRDSRNPGAIRLAESQWIPVKAGDVIGYAKGHIHVHQNTPSGSMLSLEDWLEGVIANPCSQN